MQLPAMDSVHDPGIRQCITSMALNSNILKHNPCDNYCVLKSDHPLGNQASKTVSLVLTRLQQPSSSYVHVLRCNACGFLTLNISCLKEHIRNNHPTSQGFWTYSCYQCSSMSTEKFLMEEHLKLYHRAGDVSNGKLIERFHGPSSSDIVQNSTGNPVPFTLTPANTVPSTGFTLNLVNAINAFQSVNKAQNLLESTSLSKTIPTSTVSSSPTLTTSIAADSQKDNLHSIEKTLDNSVEMKTEESISTASAGDLSSSVISSTSAVSGSRRRKATTPGRIRMQPSTEGVDANATEETHPVVQDDQITKPCASPIEQSSPTEAAFDATPVVTSKRPSSTHEPWSEATTDYPSPKRFRTADIPQDMVESTPRSVGTPITDGASLKGVIPQSLPFILSIGNPGNGMSPQPVAQTSSTIALCPQPLNSAVTSSVTPNSPFIGQLIPLCSLSDSLLCGVSSALLNNGTNSAAAGLTAHSLMGNALSVPVLDTQTAFSTPVSGSTWLLTSQPNTLTANMTGGQGHLSQLQPTVLVPVPANFGAEQLLGSTTKQFINLSSDSDGTAMTTTPTVHCDTTGSHNTSTTVTNSTTTSITNNNAVNNLRVSDVLEALKSFASGGNLAASIGLPFSASSTSHITSGTSTATSASTASGLFGVPSQSRPDSVPISGASKVNPVTHGTSMVNPSGMTVISNNSSHSHVSNGNASTTQLSAGTHVVSASGLLSQLAMAAAAVSAASSGPGTSVAESGTIVNGITATVLPTGNPEQALDMSIRSGLISLNPFTPMSNGTWVNKSTDGSPSTPQLTLALDIVDGKPIRSDQATVHGVMEALNAALKGSLQKPTKLAVSTDGIGGSQSTGENDSCGVLETGSHSVLYTPKNPTATVDADQLINSGMLKPAASGSQSILVPFPTLSLPSTGCNTPEQVTDVEGGRSNVPHIPPPPPVQQQQQSSSTVNTGTANAATSTNLTVSSSNPTLGNPGQSQLVNLAHLQALMAALTAGGTVSIPAQTGTTGNTTVVSGAVGSNSLSVLPGSIIQTGQASTAQVPTSTGDFNSNTTGLGANPILMNQTVSSSGATSASAGSGFEPAGSAMLLPTLSSLTSVCGLTLASNPSGLGSTAPTSSSVVTSSIAGNSSIAGSVPPGHATAMRSISLPSLDGLSFTNILTGTHSGAQSNPFNPTLIGNPAFINLVTANRNPSQTSVAISPAAAARLLTSLTGLTPNVLTSSSGPSGSTISTTTTTGSGAITTAASGSGAGTTHTTGNTTSLISTQSPTVQLGSTTGLVNGTLNVLDSNSQALLAAAAASGHMNHVALTNLRSSHGPTGLRPLGASTNGPVIGLLDPRTGLQFSVGTTTSALLATPELVNCLQRGVLTPQPADDSASGNNRVVEVPAAASSTLNTTSGGTTVTATVASADVTSSGTTSVLRMGAKSADMDPVSPYDSHGIDEDWEATGPSDDTVAVQVNLQSIYAGMKSDPTSHPTLTSLNPSTLLPASGTSGTTRRHTSSSRGSGLGGSSRRSLNTSSDSGGAHQGRPHRQNFTPTQNRILTEWYSKHKAKPYPSTDDTKELANISGLSYSQVKKWFANKRARSSSSGLPKPTPPMAPDSSPDPTAAKAIVAAAMAAAAGSTPSTSGLDSTERTGSLQPAFLITPQAFTSVSASMAGSSIEVEDDEPEAPLEPAEGDDASGGTPNQTPLRGNSCAGDAVTLLSVSTEDEDLPLMVVSEISVPNVGSTSMSSANKEASVIQLNDTSGNDEAECDTPKSSQYCGSSDDVVTMGLKFTTVPQSANSITDSPVASPPTLEVPLKSSVVSPVNGFSSDNSLENQVNVEESIDSKAEDPEMTRTECDEHTVTLKNSKGLRTRGLTIHAS